LRLASATLLAISLALSLLQATAAPTSNSVPKTYLKYDGLGAYAELTNSPAFSLSDKGLSVAVWMRPDALVFPKREGGQANEQYVHWLGKGQAGNQEWAFRIALGARNTWLDTNARSPSTGGRLGLLHRVEGWPMDAVWHEKCSTLS